VAKIRERYGKENDMEFNKLSRKELVRVGMILLNDIHDEYKHGWMEETTREAFAGVQAALRELGRPRRLKPKEKSNGKSVECIGGPGS